MIRLVFSLLLLAAGLQGADSWTPWKASSGDLGVDFRFSFDGTTFSDRCAVNFQIRLSQVSTGGPYDVQYYVSGTPGALDHTWSGAKPGAVYDGVIWIYKKPCPTMVYSGAMRTEPR